MGELKVLVVDDESRMRKLIKDFLAVNDFKVIEASDGEEALNVFYEQKNINLIILDVMMPKLDGWGVCKEIRNVSDIPIIMLTAKGEEMDELLGFQLGVDEYISKPFSPKILVARVEALIKRTQPKTSQLVIKGDMEFDRAGHTLKLSGNYIDLSYKEFELLAYFIDNEGTALSREKILNNVWNYDYFGDVRTVDTHVKKLRSKLGNYGEHIKTVWGLGYKFEVNK